MCSECFEVFKEEGTIPTYNNNVETAILLIKKLYNTEGGESGGYGHVVFDDLNLDCVQWCIDEIGKYNWLSKDVVDASRDALLHFLTLTDDEKVSALAIIDGHMNCIPEWTI